MADDDTPDRWNGKTKTETAELRRVEAHRHARHTGRWIALAVVLALIAAALYAYFR